PGAPLGVVTTAVQALAGVLLPSALVFLLLLCNDQAVLGPWVNPRWLNAAAGLVVAVLLVLSGLLVIATLFPGLAVDWTATVAVLACAGGAGGGCGLRLSAGGAACRARRAATPAWTMPPIETLPRLPLPARAPRGC